MSDLLHQNFDTVQSEAQPKPQTLASAAVLAPLSRLTFLTGTVQLATVTPPVTGYHELVLIFTDANPGALLTTGNLKTAYTPLQNKAFSLHYDPVSAKYWTEAVA